MNDKTTDTSSITSVSGPDKAHSGFTPTSGSCSDGQADSPASRSSGHSASPASTIPSKNQSTVQSSRATSGSSFITEDEQDRSCMHQALGVAGSTLSVGCYVAGAVCHGARPFVEGMKEIAGGVQRSWTASTQTGFGTWTIPGRIKDLNTEDDYVEINNKN